MGKKLLACATFAWGCFFGAVPLDAEIAETQVLVVYNAASADAVALKNAYMAAHPGIPAANVVALNDTTLLVANLNQTDFVAKVRDPIRNYLSAGGAPQPEDIIAIVLIRPFPHRVLDTDNPLVGDYPSSAEAEMLAGDATYASVDAELVLLWQNLTSGEAGGTMDSKADNMIDNPYHQSATAIDTFSRAWITSAKTFVNLGNVAWGLSGAGKNRLTPGDIYLVCRIDGTTQTDALATIERARNPRVDRSSVRIILDEYDVVLAGDDLDDDPLFTSGDPFLAGDDYEEARNLLMAAGWDVRYDDTFNFISAAEEPTPLIAYASYGENHDYGGFGEDPPGTATYVDGFTFVPGAIFNTIESYNGRALNGLGTMYGLEQAADFITAGGTFAVGMVFEPFSFAIPDNEFLFVNMLNLRMRWAEAAYASLPALSWQHVVLGDPLGRLRLLGDLDDDGDVDLADYIVFAQCVNGPNATVPPAGCTATQFDDADLDADQDVDEADFAMFQRVLEAP
jgi:uncharacterized protein (TIGR03790 family)